MKKIKISIRMAVLTVLILSIFFVSACVFYAVSDRFNEKLLDFVINDIENVVENCNEEVAESLIGMQDDNARLASDKEFIKLLKYDGDDVITASAVLLQIRRQLSSVRIPIREDYISTGVFYVDSAHPASKFLEDGANKSMVAGNSALYNTNGLDKLTWYNELINSEKQICIFEEPTLPGYVCFAQLIKNYVNFNNEILGVNVVGIDFESILRNYGSIENKDFLNILIVNSKNNVICTNDETVSPQIIDFASEFRKSTNKKKLPMTSASIGNREYYVGMYDLGFDMSLVAVIPEDKVFITIEETMSDIYLIMLILLVVVLIITVLLSGVIVRPIKRLSNYMESSRTDGEEVPVFSDSKVIEIDTLYKSFTSMTQRIRKLISTAQVLGEQKKEAEFRMLQTQINPHYLYNALDSISWMALKKGEDEIADMTSALADSFRYSARTSEMIIDLKSEIEFIKNYIKLQEQFRKEIYNVSVEADEEVLKLKVPKFMLQPLVENSIIHGMRRKGEPLSIKISAHFKEDILQIKIEDNGAGFDAEKLNLYLNGEDGIFDTEKIGIVNIHKRLKNKYGKEAGLEYLATNGGGLTAVLTLPMKEGEKDSEIF